MSAAAVPTPAGSAGAAVRPAGYLRRLLGRPLALLALAWLLVLLVAAVGAPFMGLIDPLELDLLAVKQWPNAEHWLGTDALGRDVLSRVVHGIGITMAGVVEAVVVAAVLGLSLGVSAGYFGGRWDRWVQQYVGLVQSLPNILILLAVLTVFGQAMLPAMVTLGVLGSGGVSRVLRSVTLAVREELYIAAARISGLSDAHIIWRHVLPRIAGPVIVQLSLFAAIAVIVQTGISFLGLGVAPPAPTWGSMISEASASLNDFAWLLVPSGGAVALTVLSFGLLGDSLRDASTESWSRPAVRQQGAVRVSVMPPDIPDGSALSMRNVTIATGAGEQQRLLVKGVSFDLRPGETLGIVGESGSGKTLTSLSLLGLLPPGVQAVAGCAVVDGEVLDLSDEKRLAQWRGSTVGMIFQEPMAALDPCFTVGYQLAEVIRLQGTLVPAQVQAKVIALLEQVKIPNPDEVARRYPHQISGGMAQRVGIARALASEPRILLADEPTTALDVTVQAEILALLRSLSQSRQMAVVLVTHDWGVVADICDRAMVLRHGQVLESASVVDLFHRPQHPYTRALLAANPHSARPGDVLPTVDDKLTSLIGAV
jgi:peptide/nickel transport system permease protein